MIKRNFIKTIVGSSAALLFPLNSLANKPDSYEDIAAKIIRWLQDTKHKFLLNNKDTYQLINAIHNNDEVYAYRGFGKTFCIILLAAYQSIKENKRILIVGEARRQDKLIAKQLSKLGFMNDNILFKDDRWTPGQIDVCYCEEIPNREVYYLAIKNMPKVKSVKKVMGREDILEITTVKNGISRNYAPSLELEKFTTKMYKGFGLNLKLSTASRWL